jgi:hypothetical protein
VGAFLGDRDGHNNADVRGMLAPLAKLAAQSGAAVVGVHHMNKGGGAGGNGGGAGGLSSIIYRASGSIALTAAARAVWVVARDRNDPSGQRRLMLPVKNNLGDDKSGFAYAIVDGAIAWEPQPVDVSADEALGGGAGRVGRSPLEREEAVEFLKEVLSGGAMKVPAIREAAARDGLSWGTVLRAKMELGVRSFRKEMNGPWCWIAGAAGAEDSAHVRGSEGAHNRTMPGEGDGAGAGARGYSESATQPGTLFLPRVGLPDL